MVQPFTSAEFLFIMAFSSAWHTGFEGKRKKNLDCKLMKNSLRVLRHSVCPYEITQIMDSIFKEMIRDGKY